MDTLSHLINLKRGQLMLEARMTRKLEAEFQRLKTLSTTDRLRELEERYLGLDNLRAFAKLHPPEPARITPITMAEERDNKIRNNVRYIK